MPGARLMAQQKSPPSPRQYWNCAAADSSHLDPLDGVEIRIAASEADKLGREMSRLIDALREGWAHIAHSTKPCHLLPPCEELRVGFGRDPGIPHRFLMSFERGIEHLRSERGRGLYPRLPYLFDCGERALEVARQERKILVLL